MYHSILSLLPRLCQTICLLMTITDRLCRHERHVVQCVVGHGLGEYESSSRLFGLDLCVVHLPSIHISMDTIDDSACLIEQLIVEYTHLEGDTTCYKS